MYFLYLLALRNIFFVGSHVKSRNIALMHNNIFVRTMLPGVLILLSLLGGSTASCPNSCSGHGICGADDVCTCYQNWGMGDEDSGDCSEMVCPFEIAWVDAPDKDGEFHKYAECAGKGICDRSTGECQCFEGFSGKGCQRMNCPGNCNGHGTCEYIEELGVGSSPGNYWGSSKEGQELSTESKTFENLAEHLWDHHKSMACLCDPGYTDVDCSRRMCPKSNDIMDECLANDAVPRNQIQNLTLYGAGLTGNGTGSTLSDFYNRTFALTFKSTLNESFTTIPIMISEKSSTARTADALEAATELALKSLPNKVITNVKVDVVLAYERRVYTPLNDTGIAFLNMNVEFSGSSTLGPQNLLMIETAPCNSGCTPQITGLDLMSTAPDGVLSFVTEKVASDFDNYECGRRGKCDYESGLCACFAGFTGQACSIQTALM